jgi:DNA-binding MarR family transcriptional regulator
MARTTAASRAAVSTDVEMRASPGDHDALRVWLRLLATTTLIETRVRRRLLEHFRTTLPRFDLMAQLDRASGGLKMNELSRRMMVTGGNVTGITDILEAEGLVRRSADPRDRRASRVTLTAAGRKEFRAMAQRHEQWIIEAFDGVEATELRALASLLGRVKTAVLAAAERAA